jgi:hypothetical protein
MVMTITYLPRKTRPPFGQPSRLEKGRNYLTVPNYQRAYDFSWWNRGVGKRMRMGHDEWRLGVWYPEQRVRRHRRAHMHWRRGHRVRRAQWATQGGFFVKYLAMGFHWLMQKHHEHAFKTLQIKNT